MIKKQLFICFFSCLAVLFMQAPLAATPFVEKSMMLGKPQKNEKIFLQSVKLSNDKKHIAFVSKSKNGMRVWFDGIAGPNYEGISIETPIFAPMTHKVGYIAMNADHMTAVIDGKKGPAFKGVDTLTFSPDGKRAAYRILNDNKKMQVMVDGKPGPEFSGVPETPGIVFSPNAENFAYAGISSTGAHILVINHKKQQTFDAIHYITFSPDSKRFAVIAERDGMWHCLNDDTMGDPFKKISQLSFSPDSRHYAYTAQKDNKLIIVKDGKELPSGQTAASPRFSPDGEQFMYVMKKNDKWHMVINGTTGPPVDNLDNIGFTKQGDNIAYSALIDDAWHVFLDGKQGPKFDKISFLGFSPHDDTLAYIAHKKDTQSIVKNQTPGPFYDMVGIPVFSGQKNGHLAYMALDKKQDKAFIVENKGGTEKKHPPYDMIGILKIDRKDNAFYDAQQPFFSPDGSRLAYPVIHKKKCFMVVDENAQKKFDAISRPYFSPDGSHIAYMAQSDDKWFVVVDGHQGKETFDGFLKGSGLVFDSPTHFSALAINLPGPYFYELSVDIQPNGS